jgi:hypothetical protein
MRCIMVKVQRQQAAARRQEGDEIEGADKLGETRQKDIRSRSFEQTTMFDFADISPSPALLS